MKDAVVNTIYVQLLFENGTCNVAEMIAVAEVDQPQSASCRLGEDLESVLLVHCSKSC